MQSGVAHVQASFNNTIVTITDMERQHDRVGKLREPGVSRALARARPLRLSGLARLLRARRWRAECDKWMSM